MFRGLALLLTTLSVALATGCGESDQEQFRDDFDPIDEQLDDLGRDVGDALQAARSKSDAELTDQFASFAADLADIGDDVEQLDPPSDLEDQVKRLEDAIADVQGSLEAIADAGEGDDPAAARAATIKLIRQGQRLDRIQQKLLSELR